MKKTAILCLGILATLSMAAAAEASVTTDGSFSADCGTKPPPWSHGPPPDTWGTLGKTCAPVPEPSTWAMMIAGVGLLGVIQLRRRGAKTADLIPADGACV
jgi:hypothetical protein